MPSDKLPRTAALRPSLTSNDVGKIRLKSSSIQNCASGSEMVEVTRSHSFSHFHGISQDGDVFVTTHPTKRREASNGEPVCKSELL